VKYPLVPLLCRASLRDVVFGPVRLGILPDYTPGGFCFRPPRSEQANVVESEFGGSVFSPRNSQNKPEKHEKIVSISFFRLFFVFFVVGSFLRV
jgi:hypothetical protein